MIEPEVRKFRLGDLNPAGYNPRSISDENLEGLKNSLAQYGCVEPIVVNVRDSRNVIIGGHQRQKALIELHGEDCQITCVAVDLDDTHEKLLNLALNNPHLQGNFKDLAEHIEKLKREIDQSDAIKLRIDALESEIAGLGASLDESFFDDGAISGIISETGESSITFVFSEQDVAKVQEAISKKGKPWLVDRIVELSEEAIANA